MPTRSGRRFQPRYQRFNNWYSPQIRPQRTPQRTPQSTPQRSPALQPDYLENYDFDFNLDEAIPPTPPQTQQRRQHQFYPRQYHPLDLTRRHRIPDEEEKDEVVVSYKRRPSHR